MTAHPIQRRYHAEELVRLRRSDEQRRYVSSQRAARIDANPHQVDAVVFALSRIQEGGCILADEVGLGKTIEAGLVIAQLQAEGARRILLVTPKPLLGQWKQELYTLFGIETREGRADPIAFRGEGIFLVGRELVGTEKGEAVLRETDRFDLCVVDEAHEVFAGIYKRFDRLGSYKKDSPHARMASRLWNVLNGSGTPVLLLTATPIQNSLAELWGLVRFVDPSGTLLGDLRTFREMFCGGDDRILVPGQEHELRRRIKTVLQRTLRRQAQDFMKRAFVGRHAQLFEYSMNPDEKQLYDDITSYLLEPGICAFSGNQRRLLLIGFHRRMASSSRALSASLEKVATRLRRMVEGGDMDESGDGEALRQDLEDDEELDNQDADDAPRPSVDHIRAELERVEGFIARAGSLTTDSKARALIQAVDFVLQHEKRSQGSGKLVIFTESLTTQEYIRELLLESGLVTDQDVTLFRGDNSSPRAAEGLARWEEEVGRDIPSYNRPSRDIAVRLALVHEFRTRSRVFISTEAGAKGLNLQFADTLVNYDLPWNPQRIEQRIGRCHRYGQGRDVTVINFLAKDNEAQRLTFEILSQKLDLFGTVFDASDEVLHRPQTDTPETLVGALGADFETRLRRIYERARTVEEIGSELRALRDTLEDRRKEFTQAHQRTAEVIQGSFDESVQQVFRRIQDELPRELAAFDRDLERVLTAYLVAVGARYEREPGADHTLFRIAPSGSLPDGLEDGITVGIGQRNGIEGADPLHLGHPLLVAALKEAREATAGAFRVRVRLAKGDAELQGRRGRMLLSKVHHGGFEATERLLPVVVLDDDPQPLSLEVATRILEAPYEDDPTPGERSRVSDDDLEDALEQLVLESQEATSAKEHERFERAMSQIERFMEDRLILLHRQSDVLAKRFLDAEKDVTRAMGAEQRTNAENKLHRLTKEQEGLENEITILQGRGDDVYQRFRDQAHARRYAAPQVERLVEAELRLV